MLITCKVFALLCVFDAMQVKWVWGLERRFCYGQRREEEQMGSSMAGDGEEAVGILAGLALHVPYRARSVGRLDRLFRGPQCRPRLRFGVPLPLPGYVTVLLQIPLRWWVCFGRGRPPVGWSLLHRVVIR